MRFYLVLLSLGNPRVLLRNGAPCCRPGLEAGHPECQANFTPPPAGACLRVYMCVCIRTYVYKQIIKYTLAFRCMFMYIYIYIMEHLWRNDAQHCFGVGLLVWVGQMQRKAPQKPKRSTHICMNMHLGACST